MWIDEDGEIDIVSDHNMLIVECMRNVGKREPERKIRKKKWRLRDAKWDEFQVCLNESAWDLGSVQDVDVMNERLTEGVRKSAVDKIGYVRMSGRKRVNKPWWNDDIRIARRERKRLNKQCRWLKKKRHESEATEEEYQNAWSEYVKQQRLTKKKIKDAKVKCERSTIQCLREKGMEGGREWYRFMRGESMTENGDVKVLKVNGECITDEKRMKDAIKQFWEEIGGVGEVFDVRTDRITLERKNADELNKRISRDEVEKCVRKQKNGKAAGPDDIP